MKYLQFEYIFSSTYACNLNYSPHALLIYLKTKFDFSECCASAHWSKIPLLRQNIFLPNTVGVREIDMILIFTLIIKFTCVLTAGKANLS